MVLVTHLQLYLLLVSKTIRAIPIILLFSTHLYLDHLICYFYYVYY